MDGRGSHLGSSGVAVTNGRANSTPTFSWQRTDQFEYQLCFKCHSGYTILAAQNRATPSRWALDKAVEFNPTNLSFHPVEAAGELDVVHGGQPGRHVAIQALDVRDDRHPLRELPRPILGSQPGGRCADRQSRLREPRILLRNYRDRVVNTRSQAYAPSDFALCYVCHAEAPMVDGSGNRRADTNFRFHGLHVSGLVGEGSGTAGTSIDVDGAGAGNATCAECHFRIHGRRSRRTTWRPILAS